MNKEFGENAGVSLIIAIIFVSVLMLVTANLAQVNLAAIKNRANKTLSDRAKDLADSALELAYNFADKKGIGVNATIDDAKKDAAFQNTWDKYTDFLKNLGVDCVDCAEFRVIGRSEAELKLNGVSYYFAPAVYEDEKGNIKGTGSAASECKDASNADDPCHWNKLYLNKATEIPLYYEDESKNIKKISGPFKLRVRAPCSDEYGEFKSDGGVNFKCENVVLYPAVSSSKTGPFRHIEKDRVLIQWIMKGGDTELFARDVLDPNNEKLRYPLKNTGNEKENTELSAGRINEAKEPGGLLNNYVVLEEIHKGENLYNEPFTISEIISSASSPVLRLNFVGQARKEDDNYTIPEYAEFTSTQLNQSQYFIPYLEYQVLTKDPIADNKVTLFGWGQISDFYKESKAEKYLPVMEGGFVLGNL